jgi:hypothetical protein
MYGVPQAGLTVPAVAGQLERGVRPHRVDDPVQSRIAASFLVGNAPKLNGC